VICANCHLQITPIVVPEARTQECPECGRLEQYQTFPLFFITGASGVGKTAILPDLRRLLPDWDVFESDTLFWSPVKEVMWACWFSIAHSLSLSGRPVIISGTVLPHWFEDLDQRRFFDPVHYLNLHCGDPTRDARLRARPEWRGITEDSVERMREFAKWLLDHSETHFDPPMEMVDTSDESVSDSAARVSDWARKNWSVWKEEHPEAVPSVTVLRDGSAE